MTKKLMLVLALVMLLLGVSAVSVTAQDNTIRIGGIHPLSGSLSTEGRNIDNAIQMAVDEINVAGGLLGGIPLEYLSADSTGNASGGQSEATRLINAGAVALICCYQSDVTASAAAAAESAGVPLVIDVGAGDAILEQGSDFVFRLGPSATALGVNGADFLADFSASVGESVESLVYLHEGTTDVGRDVAEAFVSRAEQIGLEVLDVIPYNLPVRDLTTELTLINSMAPDVLVVTGDYDDGLLIARNAEEVGLDVKAIFGVAQGAYNQSQFVREASRLSECFFDVNYRWDASNSDTVAVRDRYEDLFNEPMSAGGMLAYQAVYVIADAITRAGIADPSAIRDALAATDYDDHLLPYNGSIEFDANGENINAAPVLVQVLDGEVVQVWPEAFAEADPVYPCTSWGYPR